MTLLYLAAAAEILEKDRKDIKEGKYKKDSIYSGFTKFATGSKNITMGAKPQEIIKCQHIYSNRMWKPVKTIRVNRNGFGDANKLILEKCIRCGEERKRSVHFTDMRVQY